MCVCACVCVCVCMSSNDSSAYIGGGGERGGLAYCLNALCGNTQVNNYSVPKTTTNILSILSIRMRAPSNSVAASLFFLASIVLDALTAIEFTSHVDAPASLRGVSLILAACLAAPLVRNSKMGVYGLSQRPLIALALSTAAFLGQHHGGVNTRAFDAFYTTFVGLIAIYLFSSGGMDEMSKLSARGAIEKAVMKSASTLAGSLAFYSGMRTLRAGLQHSQEVSSFRVSLGSNSTADALGYAYSSQTASVSLTAGGAVGVAAGWVVLSYHEQLSLGTDALTTPLCAAGAFQLVAALSAGLSYGDQVGNLPAIFGATACKSASQACDAAKAARRFASANTPVSSLWVSALGLLALGFPPSFRLREKAGAFQWFAAGTAVGTVATAASLVLVVWNATFDGKGGHTDYVLLAVIFGIYTSFFLDNITGTIIYTVAMIIEEVIYVQYYGFSTLFSHLTHLTLVVTIALLILHTLLQLLTLCFRSDSLYLLAGVVTAAGTSLSLGLYLASASLLAVGNGNLGDLQDTDDGSWFAMAFVLQHFCPLLMWLSLVVCRCDFHRLGRWERTIVWVAAIPVLLVVYSLCLSVIGTAAPTASLMDEMALSAAVLGAGLVPWLAGSGM